jgi:phage gp29-like protein
VNLNGTSQFNQARIEWAIRLKYSPMPELDMEMLASQLNAFRIGEMRVVGKTWEVMMERDGELAVNADKRAADLAGMSWKVVSDGSPDGDKHAAALQYFYDHLKVTEALDQDVCGNADHLIYQMASAHSYRYSVHEMLMRVDNPAAMEVTAEFRHTPVWFFESRRGYLGYLQHIFDMYGVPCVSGEWLTCVGLGWMRPLSMAFAMKHFALRDWLLFCTRYGSGFLEGITDAQKDSPEWGQAVEALEAIANDGVVLHNRGVDFKFLDQAAKNALPFQPIIEMINGLYAKCYRGVDLATGSRSSASQPGQSSKSPVGASVQKEESGIYLVRDCKWLTGYANDRIDVPVIRYLFNQQPRAWFALMPPLEDMTSDDLASAQALVPMGLRLALSEVYGRFRWRQPEAGEPVLIPAQAPAMPGEDPEAKPAGPNGKQPNAGQQKPKPNPPPAPANGGKVKGAKGPPAAADRKTQPALEEAPIAAGADPDKNPESQTASTAMPDTQVDAGGFWSRAGLLPKGADGQTLPMPSLGYALPQDKTQPEVKVFAAAVAHDIEPMLARLAKVSGIKDDGIFKTKLHDLMRDWDALANDIQADPRSLRVLEQILQQGVLRGVTKT